MKAFTSKKNLYLLALLVVTLLCGIIAPTYAKFVKEYTTTSDVAGVSLVFNIGITNIEEYEVITVPAGGADAFNVKVTNSSDSTLYYGIWYRMVEPTEKSSDVIIARVDGTTATTSGSLASNRSSTPSIVIINNSDTEITLNIGVASSNTSTSDIEYIGGKKLISGTYSVNYMNTTNGTNYFNSDTYRTRITTASFVDYIDTTNAALDENEASIMWDMSSNQDNRIIAWLEENETTDEEGNTYYDLYIGSNEKIYAKSLGGFFQRMTNLEFINTETLNTSLSTSFNNFVYVCSNLLEIDVSNFNTSNVNTMAYAFGGCEKLRELDVSNWDTSNVNTGGNNGGMRDLFQNCKTLKELDVSNWDTSNVINMFRVFGGCSSLTSLDVSNWDISSANLIAAIFQNCSSLTSLDVSNWNTSNITDMNNFFSGCSSLVSLDVSNFDTSKVTNMGGMFATCNNLVNLDVSNFDISNVTNMASMFIGCNNLLKLDLSNFDTSKVINMNWMFHSCYNLEATLTVENINTSYTGMFANVATGENANAKIILNYVADDPSTTDVNESTESLVDAMIVDAKNLKVVKGSCTGDYCTV